MNNEPLLAELIDRSDVVFHFAAAVGVKLIVEQPVHTIETNVHGTEVVLKHANKKKKLVVIASTSEVYGKSNDLPFREDSDLVMGPTAKHRWAYACSKAIDEFLALAYWKERKLPVIIVRFFNTVGPRQTGRYGMVIPNFVRQALAGEPITVFGDGTQSRAFTHVSDVVDALLKLIQEPKAIGEVINIGNPQEVTICELAERVRDTHAARNPRSSSSPTTRPTNRDSRTCPGVVPDLTKVTRLDRLRHPRTRWTTSSSTSSTISEERNSAAAVYWREGQCRTLTSLADVRRPDSCCGAASTARGRRAPHDPRAAVSTLVAKDATVRQILAEWERVGQTKVDQRRPHRRRTAESRADQRSRATGAGRVAAVGEWRRPRAARGSDRQPVRVRAHHRDAAQRCSASHWPTRRLRSHRRRSSSRGTR